MLWAGALPGHTSTLGDDVRDVVVPALPAGPCTLRWVYVGFPPREARVRLVEGAQAAVDCEPF